MLAFRKIWKKIKYFISENIFKRFFIFFAVFSFYVVRNWNFTEASLSWHNNGFWGRRRFRYFVFICLYTKCKKRHVPLCLAIKKTENSMRYCYRAAARVQQACRSESILAILRNLLSSRQVPRGVLLMRPFTLVTKQRYFYTRRLQLVRFLHFFITKLCCSLTIF